jgi:hypothetical protein
MITFSKLDIELPDEQASDILRHALEVDEELYSDIVKREIVVKGTTFRL